MVSFFDLGFVSYIRMKLLDKDFRVWLAYLGTAVDRTSQKKTFFLWEYELELFMVAKMVYWAYIYKKKGNNMCMKFD